MYEIEFKDVTVEFTIYDRRDRSLRDLVLINPMRRVASSAGLIGGRVSVDRSGHAVIHALDGINLTIKSGDRVGLLGHNGSGKTTLLRVMARIYTPQSGTVTIKGKITPLFGVIEGLDMDATGYEAIRLRGLMLGRSKKELESSVDQIADFTELGEYLAMPLRTYSNGMLVRLGFAIATSVRPEILLMDELVGASDAGFVERAQERLNSFIESSGILVVASHNLEIVRKWCNRAFLLQQGRIIAEGGVDEVIEAHNRLLHG